MFQTTNQITRPFLGVSESDSLTRFEGHVTGRRWKWPGRPTSFSAALVFNEEFKEEFMDLPQEVWMGSGPSFQPFFTGKSRYKTMAMFNSKLLLAIHWEN